MEHDICTYRIIIIIIIAVTIVIFQHFSNNKNNTSTINSNVSNSTISQEVVKVRDETKNISNITTNTTIPQESTNMKDKVKNIVINVTKSSPTTSILNPSREYDYRTYSDPLIPPFKRDDSSLPFPSISTRGYATAFKKMGLLIDKTASNTDIYKFLILMGRQKYIGSNQYEYYATENNKDGVLKFDLPNIKKELMTDDTVTITQLNKTYSVEIDRSLGFEYNPFMY